MNKKISNDYCNRSEQSSLSITTTSYTTTSNTQDVRIIQEKTSISKPTTAIFTLIQFIISTIQLLDITLNLILKIHLFVHYEALISMFALWTLSMVWVIFTLIMFVGIIFNNGIIILSFILFNIFFTLLSFGLFILLIFEKSNIYSIFYVFFIFIVLQLTTNYSWSFFNELCEANII
uniref:MARVEL domain-containing protein n=1 Tax=Strongyloides venezuelensis TaxID=75913 RepID=A0A0K0FF42_STRVS